MENLIHLPYQKNKNLGIDKSKRIYYYSPLNEFNVHICERTKKLSVSKRRNPKFKNKLMNCYKKLKK